MYNTNAILAQAVLSIVAFTLIIFPPPSPQQLQCWRKWNNLFSPNSLHIPPASVLRQLRTTVWHFSNNMPSSSFIMKQQQRSYIVFAHRSGSNKRSFRGGWTTIHAVTNALVQKLSPTHDVVAVDPSHLSLLEQVQLFRGADGVVGQHGAGLTNIVYCRTGTVVVELPTTEHSGMRFFQDISASLGLLYGIVPGVACDKEEQYNMNENAIALVVTTVVHMLKKKTIYM